MNTKTLLSTALLIGAVSLSTLADNPIQKKNKIRKGYKTTTVVKADKTIKSNNDNVVMAKNRKGAYHIQNKNGVNTLNEAQGVNAGKTIDQTPGVYPYMKWAK
ncbi:hypothetical protein EI427_23595 [Flammeovirga pectinis]|uniref:Uncharacterized protein n=1 Tax=Flammeovirga pectinis TaxID=2494373 RepID=A0A3S9PAF0_9BACT|nr:hypothetical protein [Flammeovirga pectinis]AZQ65201.1 hypothetical protein EI427_23595 [Flammeovirga pectinis]